jgi:hypothetical protein
MKIMNIPRLKITGIVILALAAVVVCAGITQNCEYNVCRWQKV